MKDRCTCLITVKKNVIVVSIQTCDQCRSQRVLRPRQSIPLRYHSLCNGLLHDTFFCPTQWSLEVHHLHYLLPSAKRIRSESGTHTKGRPSLGNPASFCAIFPLAITLRLILHQLLFCFSSLEYCNLCWLQAMAHLPAGQQTRS